MKNYDYHRPAEKVLLDSYRKQNRNKNRLLFLAVALTVGVIFCMISFAYGKIQVDIQKHIRTDGMTVSTYIGKGHSNKNPALIPFPPLVLKFPDTPRFWWKA